MFFIFIACSINGILGLMDVRLSHQWHGRLEVKQETEGDDAWGTVCDDKFADNNNGCQVVCYQIAQIRFGIVLDGNLLSSKYETTTLPIRLDEVTCLGVELSLGECMRDFWDQHNCGPEESVGCICNPNMTVSNMITSDVRKTVIMTTPKAQALVRATQPLATGTKEATCSSYKFRIHEFDRINYPGIGRAEFYNADSDVMAWIGICDDTWTEASAKIFCSCIASQNSGMNDTTAHRAYWSPQLLNLPSVDIVGSFIHCSPADVGRTDNILTCQQTPITNGCSRSEAAGVSCKRAPRYQISPVPEVTIECTPQYLTVCFAGSGYLNESYLGVNPSCPSHTVTSRKNASNVCIGLDMEMCTPTVQSTDHQYKRYCYDISYASANANPNMLMLDSGHLRRSCCLLEKIGRVSSSFHSQLSAHEEIQAVTDMDFKLNCYRDESFDGEGMTFPAQVTRGDTIYCKISGEAWDQNLYLIVPACNITGTLDGPPVFQFHKNKCPQTMTLGLNYYDLSIHSYGFRMNLPTFQSTDQVFLSCEVYMCDRVLDRKPYCDRTCQDAMAAETLQPVAGAFSGLTRTRRDAATSGAGDAGRRANVKSGPFVVRDPGYGPMIMDDGTIRIVEPPSEVSESEIFEERAKPTHQSTPQQVKVVSVVADPAEVKSHAGQGQPWEGGRTQELINPKQSNESQARKKVEGFVTKINSKLDEFALQVLAESQKMQERLAEQTGSPKVEPGVIWNDTLRSHGNTRLSGQESSPSDKETLQEIGNRHMMQSSKHGYHTMKDDNSAAVVVQVNQLFMCLGLVLSFVKLVSL